MLYQPHTNDLTPPVLADKHWLLLQLLSPLTLYPEVVERIFVLPGLRLLLVAMEGPVST